MSKPKDELRELVFQLLDPLWQVAHNDQRLKINKAGRSNEKLREAALTFRQSALAYAFPIVAKKADPRTIEAKFVEASRAFTQIASEIFPTATSSTGIQRDAGEAFLRLLVQSRQIQRIIAERQSNAHDQTIESIDVPEQRSSPIYTKVESDRIVLDTGRALSPLLRKEAIAETRRYLQHELKVLSETLSSSNVDRRFSSFFGRLVDLIGFADDAGAISFGLHVRAAAEFAKKMEEELSDVLLLQIHATLTHASYFASQYKDWVDFLRNAREYPAREDVQNLIDDALKDVTETLERENQTVDQRIPESMKILITMLSGSKEERANALYAGVRGVENICIAAVRYAYDVASQYAQDAGRAARPTLVRVGAIVIITLALTVIGNFLPVIRNAPELGWIVENLPRIERLKELLK